MNACNGPCEQGKKPCPCPMDCQLSDDDEVSFWSDMAHAGVQTMLIVFLAIVAAVVIVHFVASNWPAAVWLVGAL